MQAQFDSEILGLKPVQLDDFGVFKYILIQILVNKVRQGFLVRGSKKFEFHADNFHEFAQELKRHGTFSDIVLEEDEGDTITAKHNGVLVEFKCIGGGRVDHSKKDQKFKVWGYSQSYGKCDHNITLKLVKESTGYPDCNYEITSQEY